MEKKLHVLILEDLPSDVELAKRELNTVLKNYSSDVVDTEEDFILSLNKSEPDLIISDYQLPSFNGLSALKITQEKFPFTPFVMLTGSMNEDTAVKCMKAGADDYVIKEHIKRLGPAVLKALEKKNNKLKRKLTEAALHKSEAVFKGIFSQAPVGIELYDFEGSLMDVNQECLNIFGIIDAEELKGFNLFDDPNVSEKHKTQLKTGISVNYESEFDFELVKEAKLYNTTRSGKCFLHVLISPFRSSGQDVSGYVVHVQEITQRKQAEEELIIAKEKAEESDRLKSAFLANMSHEIRTPMNGILGFANLLKEPKLSGEEQEKYLKIIERSGRRMLNIINDLMNISKIESGQMQVFTSELNVNDQLQQLYTFFKPEAESKGLTISFNNSLASSDSIIKCDKEKVYAILANLIKNAIKYSDTGSVEFGYNSITSTGSACEGDKASDAEEFEFYVKDTGIGIPNDKLESIFERFVQADLSLSRPYEGAGLGLSIAKAYVDMLGGKIWVESIENKGSQFYFTIPCKACEEEITIAKAPTSETLSKNLVTDLKILIVEDEDIALEYLSILLENKGKEILRAENGLKAIEICKQNKDIDLILMDMKMPKMNGFEATKHIREFNKNVYIIAQTAFALMGDKEKALQAGCNDYISKPVNKDLLFALIEKHF